jgi:hypothetical protein
VIHGHLGLAPTLSYFQAAGLWFLVSLLFAWVGIGVRPAFWARNRRRRDWSEIGDRVERTIRRHVSRWVEDDEGRDDPEARIKRGLGRWVGVEEDIDWDDLGEHIERKIKQKIRDWADEE